MYPIRVFSAHLLLHQLYHEGVAPCCLGHIIATVSSNSEDVCFSRDRPAVPHCVSRRRAAERRGSDGVVTVCPQGVLEGRLAGDGVASYCARGVVVKNGYDSPSLRTETCPVRGICERQQESPVTLVRPATSVASRTGGGIDSVRNYSKRWRSRRYKKKDQSRSPIIVDCHQE